VDKELPLLLGRPFLRTCGAVIDIGRGTISTDDGVIRHTYFPKPRAKAYLENFEIDEEDDWISCFNVGRDEDGNPKYGPMAPSFLDIEDEMERALAIEAYFNPFKNIIVFKKLIDFLGSLPVQLKNTDWGNEGYGMYKKIEGDGAWHAKFDKATKSSFPNPLIAKYEKRNDKGTINYMLQQVKNANLKWRDLPSMERHAYCERLSRRNKQEELFTHKEEMAPMALSDSKVNNDKSCSKTCLTNYEALKKQYDDLLVKLDDTGFKAATYKRGLATLEDQIVKYREHEVLFSEEIALLKRSVGSKEYQMGLLRAELEKVKQENEGFDFKIAKFDKSAKDLD
ncbi:hypothetical protein Tco_1150196, partial [Tanacetum coccineum]